jgi:hypothetical protein
MKVQWQVNVSKRPRDSGKISEEPEADKDVSHQPTLVLLPSARLIAMEP